MTCTRVLPLTALVLATAAPAALAQDLSISPSVIELQGAPGQSTTQQISVTNRTGVELQFVLEAQDVLTRDGKRVFLPAGECPGSIAATAVFLPRAVTVPSGQSRSVRVTITLPRSVEHRAMVALFRGTTLVARGKSAATLSLGALLTFALSDRVSLAASTLELVPQTPSRNASFSLPVTNDGPDPLVARGVAAILDRRGVIVGRAPFESRRLLPGERFTFRSEYGAELPPGEYRVIATLEWPGGSVTRQGALQVQ